MTQQTTNDKPQANEAMRLDFEKIALQAIMQCNSIGDDSPADYARNIAANLMFSQAATAAAVVDGYVIPKPTGYRAEDNFVTLYYPCGVDASAFEGITAAAPKADGGGE